MGSTPENPRILLTGASTGIGLALAKILKKTQCRLMATTRESSLERLRKHHFVESPNLLLRALDVTNAENRKKVVAEMGSLWGGVDVLINNAGISYRSVIEEMTPDEDRAQLETNFVGPIDLARLVLPYMREQRWGKIINISSVGGMMAMPTMGSYSASKFALEGASEALWYELKPWNISVTLIEPGFVHSNSFRHVYWSKKAKESSATNGPYYPYYKSMGKFIEKLMGAAFATPNSIAEQIERCIRNPNPPLRITVTIDAWAFSMLRRFLPRPLYHWILYRNLPGVKKWGAVDEN